MRNVEAGRTRTRVRTPRPRRPPQHCTWRPGGLRCAPSRSQTADAPRCGSSADAAGPRGPRWADDDQPQRSRAMSDEGLLGVCPCLRRLGKGAERPSPCASPHGWLSLCCESLQQGGSDETCPLSTGERTRPVQSVRGGVDQISLCCESLQRASRRAAAAGARALRVLRRRQSGGRAGGRLPPLVLSGHAASLTPY
jgi:hypothetical protein